MLCRVFVALAAILGAWSEPVVSPKHQQVKWPAQPQVQCVFPKPLRNCRVRVTDFYGFNLNRILDFKLGAKSPQVRVNYQLSALSYVGDGLDKGHCGVRLAVNWYYVLLVECHGQDGNGDWTSGFGLVTSTGQNVLPSTSTPEGLMVASPGGQATVLLQTGMRLTGCHMTTPAAGYADFLVTSSRAQSDRYRVPGAERRLGECGATLDNVSRQDAGIWWWWANYFKTTASQATVLLVQVAPEGDPKLVVKSRLGVGDVLHASCRAPPSVPPASLSWYLGNREVRRDDGNREDVCLSHPWHPRPVVQAFTHRLTAEDFGKRLECRMGHSALLADRSVGFDLIATVAPTARTTKAPTPPPPSTCPALGSRSVRVKCSLSGVEVDCVNAAAPIGTTGIVGCRPGFKPRGRRSPFHTTTCKTKGRWGPKPLNCQLDCGLRRGGQEARVSEFPWHVAVFRKQNESYYKPICGGSLVTRKFFVSAGNCFWSDSERKALSKSVYRAAVGKHSLQWETEDDDEQRRSIRAIHLPEHFEGYSKRLESDIAVVQLSSPVDVTPAVNVVCMDWNSKFERRQLTAGNNGTVPGWGLDDAQNATLRFVDLLFVPFSECRDSVPLGYYEYVSAGKICGGFVGRSTGICTGNLGGGFVFPEGERAETRFYLRGIASSSPKSQGGNMRCQAEHRTAFTKVSAFAKWIERTIETADRKMEEV